MRMKIVLLLPLLAAIACVRSAGASPPKSNPIVDPMIGQHVPPFTAEVIDVSGKQPKTAAFDSQKTKRITVYAVVGTRCSTTAAYVERLKQLEKTYGPKGVDFIYVYPNREDTREAKLAFHKSKPFTGRLIDDQGARVARALNAKRTAELFVIDPKGTIVYHGAIDDSRDPAAVQRRYLAQALDEVLAGKVVTVAASQVFA